MKKPKVIDIYERDWKTEDIHYWTNPKDGVVNASVLFDGKSSRLRAGLIIIKDGNQILLGHEKDEPKVFSLPGGSINKGESFVDAAIREAQEEVGITAKNVEEAGIDYCEIHDEVKDWVRDNVPDEEWWYNYYTVLCIGEYDKEYKGKVDKEDKDPTMKKSAEFYLIDEVIDDPSFKQAWKETLINYGYYKKPINESYIEDDASFNFTLEDIKKAFPELTSDTYQPGGPIFILPDGSFISVWKKYQVHDFFVEECVKKILNIDVYELEETWDIDELPNIFYKHFNIIKVNDGLGPVEPDFYFEIPIKFVSSKQWASFQTCLDYAITKKLKTKISGYVLEAYKIWNISNTLTSDNIIEDCKVALRKGYFLESVGKINESSRASLISKSKGADKYANGKGSRWTQKSKCAVASTVKDYNKIDMNTFWKEDKLTFGVKVTGETNDYIVTISFNNILEKIQRKIHDNKQLLEFKCIYDALIQAINTGDVLVSCTCPDYRYRIKYWNSKNGDEAGTHETRAADITNPDDSKGPACKHILAVLNNVEWLNKVASVINNYANYCKDNMEYNYSKYIFPKLYGMDYKKAVQMTLDDYDENGEIKGDLKSDEELINLSNALGKVRGRIKKGSNKNPAAKKKEESLEESLILDEDITEEPELTNHFDTHCEASDHFLEKQKDDHFDNTPFTANQVATKEEYRDLALWFVTQLPDDMPRPSTKNNIVFTGPVELLCRDSLTAKSHKDFLVYCKTNEKTWHGDKQEDVYLFATYFLGELGKDNKYEKAIRTFFKTDETNLNKKKERYQKVGEIRKAERERNKKKTFRYRR